MTPDTIPSLFHITHAKAGSTWIANVLRSTYGEKNTFPRFGSAVECYEWKPSTIYPAVFLSFQQFEELPKGEGWRSFYVMRDLRDTLVSLYFSLRYTHTTKRFGRIQDFRDRVSGMSDEEGMKLLFRERAADYAGKVMSWLDSEEVVVRYEDLIASKGRDLAGVLDRIGMPYDPNSLESALEQHWFENVYGRKLGELDEKSHGRQGLPGDWKNYESPEFSEVIEEHLLPVLRKGGYVRDGE